MSDWPTVLLGDISQIGAGNAAPQDPSLFVNGTIPFIRTSDVGKIRFGHIADAEDKLNAEGQLGLKLWPRDTILFPKSGASTFLNHRVIMDVEAFVASHLATIIPNKSQVFPHFLKYYLHTVRAQDLTQDHNYPSLRLPEIGSIRVPLPPLDEQKRIVTVLDEVFEGIAKAVTNVDRNLLNAQELFDEGLQNVFASENEGWVHVRIDDVCTLRSGHTLPPTAEKTNGEIPYLKVADMNFPGNETEIITSSRYVDLCSVNAKGLIPPGATIFPKRGGAILTNKKRITRVTTWLDLNIMAVIPSTRVDAEYLHMYFQSVDMRRLGSGSSIPQINNYDIGPLLFSMPVEIEEQRRVADNLLMLRDNCLRLQALYEERLEDLRRLQGAVLQKAFSGQLAGREAVAA